MFDDSGNLFASDCLHGYIFRIDPSGHAEVFAGTGISSPSGGLSPENVPALEADLHCPAGLAIDGRAVLVSDHANNRIRRIGPDGRIRTIVGSGPIGTSSPGELRGDGGPASEAWLQEPDGLLLDAHGNLFIADRANDAIRRVDIHGTITTVAGTGEWGYSGDGGPAIEATLRGPEGLAFDARGDLLVADWQNHRIRKIDQRGTITTIAGTGGSGSAGDGGPAIEAELSPDFLAFDRRGNLYVSDAAHNVIRMIDSEGAITTVIGTGEAACAGLGGPAVDASISFPIGLAFDRRGRLYVSTDRCGILRLTRDGRIEVFARRTDP